MTISVGKRRGLAQCSTARGLFAALALDHRGNLRQALNPGNPDVVSYNAMVDFKVQVIRMLSPFSSAVLVDPEIGAHSVVAQGALSGSTGFMVAVEATGYTGDPNARCSQVLPGWGVEKIRRMGASAVKLLVYYHPEADLAPHQEELVEQVGNDCARYDLPLFLEPLSFSLDPQKKKLPPDELHQVVIETARRLTPLGVDILKAEFPMDVKAQLDESVWMEACQELSRASVVPWILLSAGVTYDTYLRQVNVACQAGASGILAGRAVWQEAAELQGEQRLEFLRTTATERMQRLTALCDALGRPWTDAYPFETNINENWYLQYAGM